MTKEFKPNLKWLQKVANREVYSVFSYSARRGGSSGFVGGKVTYDNHLKAGYVDYAPMADLGRPGIVKLTDKGREALDTLKTKAEA